MSTLLIVPFFPHCRRYPTVEKRAQHFNGLSYVPVPEDGPFVKALLSELRLTDEDQHFVERRDGCSRINKTSTYALQAEGGEDLWPVVAFQKGGLIYASLPLVEQPVTPRPPLFSISGVSQALGLLAGLMAFVSSSPKSEAERNAKIGQLPSLLMQACPLGTPLDTNLNGGSSWENSTLCPGSHPQKPPAWRTCLYKGKPQVNVCITEKVKSVQYDKRDSVDMWQVYGSVTCKVRRFFLVQISLTYLTHECTWKSKRSAHFYLGIRGKRNFIFLMLQRAAVKIPAFFRWLN